MRVGFISDLHIDMNTNMLEQAVDGVCEGVERAGVDKIFFAGDVTGNGYKTLEFMEMLKANGIEAYTIFGNHEYWSMDYSDSQTLDEDDVGYGSYIHGRTIELSEDKVVIGIDGLFDCSFILDVMNGYTENISKDVDKLIKHGKRHFDLMRLKIKDYNVVFEDMMYKLERELKKNKGKDITIVTHYVPNDNFVLYNRDKVWTTNNAFLGSNRVSKLAEEYSVSRVIFGHTHKTYNMQINGVDYHCNPVGYKGIEHFETFRDRFYEQLKVIDI